MTEQELNNEILLLLGCGVENGRLFDYDTKQYLIFNGNYITTPDSVIVHKRDVRFEPLRNSKLAEYLLNVMLNKEAVENGLYVTVMSVVDNPESIPPCIGKGLSLSTNMGIINTSYYYNYCIACIDLIHRIAGVPIDTGYLRGFDYTKEQLLSMYQAKNKEKSNK